MSSEPLENPFQWLYRAAILLHSPCPQCSGLRGLCVKSFFSFLFSASPQRPLRLRVIFVLRRSSSFSIFSLLPLPPYFFTSTQPQLSFPHARFQLPRPRGPP